MSETMACTVCQQTGHQGHYYDAVGDSGMRLTHFWVCNPCAVKLGPGQGVSADYKADMAQAAGG